MRVNDIASEYLSGILYVLTRGTNVLQVRSITKVTFSLQRGEGEAID
jgi:hypothetical protein